MRQAVRLALFAASVLCAPGLSAHAVADPLPAALSQPALISPRALHALTLGLARAGERVVAVGARGIVLLSDDEGHSWRQARSVPVSTTLTAVRFASASEGWAVGHLGVILHTTDAGETWQRQLDGQQVASLLRKAADRLPDATKADSVAAAEQLVADGPDKPFLDLSVAPGQVMAVGAYGIAVRSQDGGQSWMPVPEIDDPQGLHLYALSEAGDVTLLAGEQGFLAVRHGGAFTLARQTGTATLFGALTLPDGPYIAFGLGGRLLRATADDAEWRPVDSNVTGAITSAVTLPDRRVLIGTDRGELAIGDRLCTGFRAVRPGSPMPITAMLVAGDTLVLAGPTGPWAVPLHSIDGSV